MTTSDPLNSYQYSDNQNFTDNASFQKPGLGETVKRWLGLNSFGGRLFWMIMLGALAGMGGMAFLFSEMLKRQAEDQVQGSINSKVNEIASVTKSAETLAYSLGVSATTLHERQAQFPDTYRELVLQLFEERPDFVVGLGLGQSEYGLIEDQPWLFPYYSASAGLDADAADADAIRYEDFADDVGDFYPDSPRYQTYFEPQANVWTAPYQDGDSRLLTYYYPLTDSDGDWLGSTLVDIDIAYLSNLLDDVVFQKAGNFLLVTRSGEVIANPKNPSSEAQTYQNIAGLADIWASVDGDTAKFLRGDKGFWAYAPVPGQDWLLFGFVPYKAIYGRIVRIATITTALMGLLLAAVVYLAIRKLNQRIKPILLQANQFANTDQSLMASSTQHDELEQLSLSFFNMLNQINLHQETIRRQEETITQSNLYADQVTEKFLAFTTQIDEEAHEQKALLKKVQEQLAEQSDVYQAVDSRLDALFSVAQTLSGFLETIPSETEANQVFDSLDHHIQRLTQVLEHAEADAGQPLLSQLNNDVTNLKTYSQQQYALEQLQHQTSDIAQDRQATVAKSQAMVTAAQSINQILAEIEAITNGLNYQARNVSNMLWGNLQLIPEEAQATDLSPAHSLESLDQAITTAEDNLVLDSTQMQSLDQTIAHQENDLSLDHNSSVLAVSPEDADIPGVVVSETKNILEVETDLQLLDQAIAEEASQPLDDPWE
ncbi:MAG: Cache domain-containing protein [Cyanobacteria bacterium P01_C01_bin.118]